MREYILKEYGSWSVLLISFLIGLGVSREFSWAEVPLLLSLGILINAKQPFTRWRRAKAGKTALWIFLVHIAVAAAILLVLYGSGITMLLPLLVFPAAYLLANAFAGEHAVVTELLGFALLSLAGVLAKHLMTGGLDVPLFTGLVMYFCAGVFKVRTLLRRRAIDRVLTALWLVLAFFAYRGMHLPYLLLLPLADNLLVALSPYRVKLKTTGWIEVGKGILFLALFIGLY